MTSKQRSEYTRPRSKALLVSIIAAALVSTLAKTDRALAFCRLTTEDPRTNGRCGTTPCATGGEPLVWKQRCISFSIGERAAKPDRTTLESVVDASFATWSAVTCNGERVAFEFAGTAEPALCQVPSFNKHDGNANSIIFVKDLEEFNRRWREEADLTGDSSPPPQLGPEVFGLTFAFHDARTGEILDADMIVNESAGELGICDRNCPPGIFDLQNVVTHEVGHFLGLGHSEQRDSTMSACASLGETSKRDLMDDDRAGLCAAFAGTVRRQCEPVDFEPVRGFWNECASAWPDTSRWERSAGCSASRAHPQGAASGAGVLSLLLLVAHRFRGLKRYRGGRPWPRRDLENSDAPEE